MAVEHDEIGIWSEVKLAIVKEYASTYTKIMDAQRRERIPSLRWLYIDGYAGSGHHVSKTRGDLVEGSPLIALNTVPPFHEYHFIDSDAGRAAELRKHLATGRTSISIPMTATASCSEKCSRVPITANISGLCASSTPTTLISRGE